MSYKNPNVKCTFLFRYLKKELPILEKYESYFRTALKSGYIRNLTDAQVDELLPIYERASGRKYPLCKRCGSSKLNFIKEVGKKYFEQTGKEL